LRLVAATVVASLLAAGGVVLISAAAVADSAGPPSVSALAVGLPAALAPVAGVLVATWPLARRPVSPVGRSRGTRIVGLPAALVMTPLVLLAAFAFGSGRPLTGVGAAAFVAAALALFVRGQIQARPRLAVGAGPASDAGMLCRTPGIASVGAMVTIAVLVVGAANTGVEWAWTWAFLPSAFTLFVVYATVLFSLARQGSIPAFVLAGFLAILIVWGLNPELVDDRWFPVLHVVAVCLTALGVVAVERARATTSAALNGSRGGRSAAGAERA
jgi:hypothetical protein